MRSIVDIQADITEARAAISKIRTRGTSEGADGASVTRMSMADAKKDLADLEAELNAASGGNRIQRIPTIGVGY
jgi:hypothetical protein